MLSGKCQTGQFLIQSSYILLGYDYNLDFEEVKMLAVRNARYAKMNAL